MLWFINKSQLLIFKCDFNTYIITYLTTYSIFKYLVLILAGAFFFDERHKILICTCSKHFSEICQRWDIIEQCLKDSRNPSSLLEIDPSWRSVRCILNSAIIAFRDYSLGWLHLVPLNPSFPLLLVKLSRLFDGKLADAHARRVSMHRFKVERGKLDFYGTPADSRDRVLSMRDRGTPTPPFEILLQRDGEILTPFSFFG